MKKLLLTFLVGASASFAHAQATNTNTAPKTSERLQHIIIRGILVAVDKHKQTVSIAPGTPETPERDKAIVFLLTPETKLYKDGVRATLDDAVIGQKVHYSLRPGREGSTNEVTVLRFVSVAKQESNK